MKIIFCIPGNSFSNRFLKCWTNLTKELHKRDIEYELINEYIPNIYQVRGMLLGANIQYGPTQHPWQGKKDYDYIMWIDSDQVFEPNDFFKLLEHDKDIVSALIYKKPKGDSIHDIPVQFACNIESNRQLFSNEATGELIKVWSNGMGWMLIKKGVFEKIDYPWFYPINTNDGVGIHGEDISFQIRAKDAGFDSYVDTSIIVGHEKDVVLK
jgi:hypothetical protein